MIGEAIGAEDRSVHDTKGSILAETEFGASHCELPALKSRLINLFSAPMRKKKATRKLHPIEGHFEIKGTDLPVRHGTLSYSPKQGIRLRSYDRFRPETDKLTEGYAKYETMHGVVEDASHVRLYNCEGYEHVRYPGTAHTIYQAEYLVYGYCRLGLNEKRINKMIGRLRHLRKWLGLPGYNSKFEPIEGNPEIKYNHSLVGVPQRKLTLFEDASTTIRVGIQRFVPIGKVESTKGAISETAQVIFTFADHVDIPTAADAIEKLERFLGFVTQVDMPITGLDLRITKPELDAVTDKWLLHKRDELHPMYHFRYPKMKKPDINGVDPFLYPFALIKEDFQVAYANWLKIYDDLRPALDQFFEHRYNHEAYEASKHAYYSFIFEGVHKKLKREKKGKGLEGRYAEVLARFAGYGQFFSQERMGEYNKKLVDTRNLIAHQGELAKTSPINFDNLIQYNQLNQMLITYMVLSACGLDQPKLLNRLTSENQFTYFQWANAEM